MADLKGDGRHFEVQRAESSQSGFRTDLESLEVEARTPAIDPNVHEVQPVDPRRSLLLTQGSQGRDVGYREYRQTVGLDTHTRDVRPTTRSAGARC